MRELVFTDYEKRIFLVAMAREIDNEICSDVNLVEICRSIQRKVILSELWEQESV